MDLSKWFLGKAHFRKHQVQNRACFTFASFAAFLRDLCGKKAIPQRNAKVARKAREVNPRFKATGTLGKIYRVSS
jgi:hypothetical protein